MRQPSLGTKTAYLVQTVRRGVLDVFDGAAAVSPALLPLRVLQKTNWLIQQYS